uniref:UDP-glucuronosyltransferase n=1 Tax=Labrus bergylta TaxID=56723 RepID=A0A3Q3GN57_9LABR
MRSGIQNPLTVHPRLYFRYSSTWLSLVVSCDGGKVLVYPTDGSHWLNMKILVEALYLRGHEITVIRSSTSWYISEFSPHYTSITIPQEHLLGGTQISIAQMINSIFENKTLTKELKEAGFDVCLTDPVFPGGVLLAHYLKLPMVFNVRWIYNGDGHFAIAPSPLSYVPQLFSHYSDKMDFFQRANNIFLHSILVYMYKYVTNPPYQAVCDRYFGTDVSAMSIMQGADIWLMRVDFTFELPRPTMPNVVYIGGFQGKPSKPLQADLEEFVQSSGEHGVVIMTLGTLLGDPGPELSEIIASAFANLPQKVVWRHVGKRPATLGNNTMLVKWLPQNNLLGHPKTKVFVTHGGTNGIYEAIYHGVPILGIPLILDQFDNMVRMKAHGAAEMVEATTMDVESLTNALKNILNPEKPYKQNIGRQQVHLLTSRCKCAEETRMPTLSFTTRYFY